MPYDVVLKNGRVIDPASGLDRMCDIDIHLHAYWPLGFLNPDTLGVFAGVTAFVDAGSSGPYNYPQLETLLGESCQTDWLRAPGPFF